MYHVIKTGLERVQQFVEAVVAQQEYLRANDSVKAKWHENWTDFSEGDGFITVDKVLYVVISRKKTFNLPVKTVLAQIPSDMSSENLLDIVARPENYDGERIEYVEDQQLVSLLNNAIFIGRGTIYKGDEDVTFGMYPEILSVCSVE